MYCYSTSLSVFRSIRRSLLSQKKPEANKECSSSSSLEFALSYMREVLTGNESKHPLSHYRTSHYLNSQEENSNSNEFYFVCFFTPERIKQQFNLDQIHFLNLVRSFLAVAKDIFAQSKPKNHILELFKLKPAFKAIP